MSLLLSTLALLPLTLGVSQKSESKPVFTFAKQGYFHRYTKGTIHEFTPKGQSDLKKWTDMFTINDYQDVKSAEALAERANSVLDNYNSHKAVIVKTDSVPRTAKKPAEHLVVALFPQPTFIEAAFTRFVMNKGKGASLVYSHRIYGSKAGDAMSKWLEKNGEKFEKELMAMPAVPKH